MSFKSIVLTLFIPLIPFGVFGQVRLHSSTTSAGGSSKTIWVGEATRLVQQSIGQSSVTGTRQSGAYFLRQGFIQPHYAKLLFEDDVPVNLSVFPNPFQDKITVSITGEPPATIRIEVTDLQGRSLLYRESNATSQTLLDIGSLSPGQYIMKIKKAQIIHIVKLIKM